MANGADERRIFFRIDSELTLEYTQADTFHLKNKEPETYFPDSHHDMELFGQIHRLDKEAAIFLTTLSEQNRALGEYLKLHNRKVDLIARRLLSDHHSQQEAEPQQVNLSEGGLAFTSNKPYYKDSHLALHIRFMEDYSSIATYATVIRCDNQGDKHFRIACRFSHIDETKRELISRHIMHLQRSARRRELSDPES